MFLGLKGSHRITEVGWREVLVSERHARVFMP